MRQSQPSAPIGGQIVCRITRKWLDCPKKGVRAVVASRAKCLKLRGVGVGRYVRDAGIKSQLEPNVGIGGCAFQI